MVSGPLGITLFVLGVYLLGGYAALWRSLERRRAAVERGWQEVADLLNGRGERALLLARTADQAGVHEGIAADVKEAYRLAQAAVDRAGRIQAEQELSRTALALADALSRDPRLSTRADLSAPLAELWERERYIAAARERYNEAAATLNAERRAFPTGLLVRALQAEPVPEFEGASGS